VPTPPTHARHVRHRLTISLFKYPQRAREGRALSHGTAREQRANGGQGRVRRIESAANFLVADSVNQIACGATW
jgi:hypothetical protein